jgi:hypothetical protein
MYKDTSTQYIHHLILEQQICAVLRSPCCRYTGLCTSLCPQPQIILELKTVKIVAMTTSREKEPSAPPVVSRCLEMSLRASRTDYARYIDFANPPPPPSTRPK